MPVQTSAEAAELVRKRWTKPENVERRVDALAGLVRRTVDSLPPLSEPQQAKLLDAVLSEAAAA